MIDIMQYKKYPALVTLYSIIETNEKKIRLVGRNIDEYNKIFKEVNKISLNNNLKYRIYDSVCKDYTEKIKNLDNLANKEKTLMVNYLVAIKRTYIKLLNNKNVGA